MWAGIEPSAGQDDDDEDAAAARRRCGGALKAETQCLWPTKSATDALTVIIGLPNMIICNQKSFARICFFGS